MIQSKIFFSIKCDCCGDLFEGADYSYWWPTSSDDYMLNSGWTRYEGGHVCPNCYKIEDDDETVLLKPFIKPEPEKPKTDMERFKELFDSVGVVVVSSPSNELTIDESIFPNVKTRSGAYVRIDFDKDGKFEVFNVFDY